MKLKEKTKHGISLQLLLISHLILLSLQDVPPSSQHTHRALASCTSRRRGLVTRSPKLGSGGQIITLCWLAFHLSSEAFNGLK